MIEVRDLWQYKSVVRSVAVSNSCVSPANFNCSLAAASQAKDVASVEKEHNEPPLLLGPSLLLSL